ncbi:NAD(P)-binding domain-containing protein [uncultured Bacteroides sp.]|uniref:NAD(P)-dependent oxidoreductase n=1 Tax=uncultured Bacteroides sp. TaxID=162156 RepID=UPI002AABFE5E|nr:NAD(P)-binding domain-containing protein [uncultured Bacteroides sp.]
MKIAILGTGLMGAGLAEGFIKAGHETIVYNRTITKTESLVALGAKAVGTPAEAIEAADAAILVLSDGAGVRNVLLDDVTKSVLKGKKILNASTTTSEEIEEIAQEVARQGGELAEMSILVGAEQLRSKQGQFIIACNEESEALWTGILRNIGENIFYVGKIGNASKAESPMLFGSMFISATVAYAAAVALKLNIPQEIAAQQIAMFAPGAEYLLPNMFARNYDQVMASVDSFKTVSNTAISSAKSLGIPTKVLEDILAIFTSAAERGFGAKDGSSILEVLLESNK